MLPRSGGPDLRDHRNPSGGARRSARCRRRPRDSARTETVPPDAQRAERYRGADDAHGVRLNAGPALAPGRREALRAIERRLVGRFAAVIAALRPDLDRGRLAAATMSLFGRLNRVSPWFRDDGPLSRDDCARLACELMPGGLPAVAVR
ncbi:MAG: hypothetical protein N2Z62_05015 [Rhodobacteraceae bacterium]|nr:hypothetical protein [Paracoccaceae bacterium]